mgnify:CR=1 FL=1
MNQMSTATGTETWLTVTLIAGLLVFGAIFAVNSSLHSYLMDKGIRAKVHYPIPLHLQEAAQPLGYREGDFPVCEEQCRTIISLPVHEHLTQEELDYTATHLRQFYTG